jgi:hypothetical protein
MLKEDYDLTREDIQLLSNRDALTAFFAKLGYDTNARLVQNAAAMGFSSDNLRPAITHIERLASQDARMFEVYLFELKAVTVTITQAIVRGFRNRPGDYLLVLTDNYERLDFVLVERYSAGSARTQALSNSTGLLTSTPKQVGVRPRVLTVNRRKPDEIDLRVLRRFTFTTLASERAYYLEKARNLYDYCMTKDDQLCITGFVEHHLSQEPEESDVVHDLLAFLAEEMIRLNREKRKAQKEFLDWLVTTLKILPDRDGREGIEVLTGKSKIADYPGDYQKGESPLAFEELLDILLRNKGRLGVSLSDGGLVERIKTRYEESLGRVLPVKERLAKTDALIDQVVYRLYGLTEEEIGMVEGKE